EQYEDTQKKKGDSTPSFSAVKIIPMTEQEKKGNEASTSQDAKPEQPQRLPKATVDFFLHDAEQKQDQNIVEAKLNCSNYQWGIMKNDSGAIIYQGPDFLYTLREFLRNNSDAEKILCVVTQESGTTKIL